MALSVKEVADSVLHIQAKTQFELASTFMRLQEFYESPFDGIRGKVFSHEHYLNVYAARPGGEDVFSYFEDWHGFNVPGNVFNRWAKRFKRIGLWKKEQELIDLVHNQIGKTNKFYVIGTFAKLDAEDEGMVINHELSHAWYYLDQEYRKESAKLLRKVPKTARYQLAEWLKMKGYDKSVVEDESIAYLSTDTMADLDDRLTPVPWNKILPLQMNFTETKDKKFSEMKSEDN